MQMGSHAAERAADVHHHTKRAGKRSFGKYTLIRRLRVIRVGDLNVIRLMLRHELIARHTVSHGVHERRPGKDTSGDKIFVKRATSSVGDDLRSLATSTPSSEQESLALREVPDSYKAGPPTDEYQLDQHGHLIVDHDLFNHDGLTQDGIAEAFQDFAKKEKLTFAYAGKETDKEQLRHLDAQILVSPLSNLPESYRLDAEYFQPRIQHLFQVLSRSGKRLGDVARLREKPLKEWAQMHRARLALASRSMHNPTTPVCWHQHCQGHPPAQSVRRLREPTMPKGTPAF